MSRMAEFADELEAVLEYAFQSGIKDMDQAVYEGANFVAGHEGLTEEMRNILEHAALLRAPQYFHDE